MRTSGYSGTPLENKLGLKDGFKIRVINQPDYYFGLFQKFPTNIDIFAENNTKKNLIHFFVTQLEELNSEIIKLKSEIEPNGIIWISWPKKNSDKPTDLNENIIREIALANGLVDIKVCAVDNVWSGLKLVIPVKNR